MFLIANLLDSAKASAKIESDYRLAKVIGITHSVISGYRAGKSLPNESIIAQLCALSGDDPDVIAAQIQAARSKSPEAKNLWLRVAARMQGAATTAILSVCFAITLIAVGAQPARAMTLDAYKSGDVDLLYIVQSTILSVPGFLLVRLRQWRWLLWLFSVPCMA
jgi:transcriptional regulator with XRE-family HTH domain